MLLVQYGKGQDGLGKRHVQIVDVKEVSMIPPDMSDPGSIVDALFSLPFNGWDKNQDELGDIYIAAIKNAAPEDDVGRMRLVQGQIDRLHTFATWVDENKSRPFYADSELEMSKMAWKARYVASHIDLNFPGSYERVAVDDARIAEEQRLARRTRRIRRFVVFALVCCIGCATWLYLS